MALMNTSLIAKKLVRSEGLEPPTPWFEARHSKINLLILYDF